MKRRILFTAPLPPPIHGMSLATKMLLEGLGNRYKNIVIDTAMDKRTLACSQPSIFSPRRLIKAIWRLVRDSVLILFNKYSVHYLCTGIGFRAIVRYLPYTTLSYIKRKPYIIHVHNGAFKMMYDSLSKDKRKIINFMFGKAAGIIVLGDSLRPLFYNIIDESKIFTVENCVDNSFVSSKEDIDIKHKGAESLNRRIRVLYLSNLMKDKGVIELMQAVAGMDNVELHLAGAIENSEITKQKVEMLLSENSDKFIYHGIVAGENKKQLLKECDIFALPTNRGSIEGQPISILEAYANGLAVVTDPLCGGIGDIFKSEINGISCIGGDSYSIKSAIEKASNNLPIYVDNNYKYFCSNFTQSKFVDKIENIFDKVVYR